MRLTAILDHVARGLAKVAIPFQGLARLEAIATALLTEIQELEDTIADYVRLFDVDQADLPRLKLIGKWVGVVWQGWALEDFRAAVRARIAANLSRGNRADLWQVYLLLVGEASLFSMRDSGAACVEIFQVDGEQRDPALLRSYLDRAKAAGVHVTVLRAVSQEFLWQPVSDLSLVLPGSGFDHVGADPSIGGNFANVLP